MDGVDEQLEAILAAGAVGVAVATGDVAAAAGVADLGTGELLSPDHRFRIGSVTKIFVATLVLQLVADGLIDLDAEAAPFVEGVSVRQLLNHTSGLDDFDIGPAFWEPFKQDRTRRWDLSTQDELRLALEKPRLFAPGEGWAYHGSNYVTLRLVVEQATGLTLPDLLRRHILGPLGLTQTDLVEEPLRGNCARGYIPSDNPILPGAGEPVDVTELDLPFYRTGGGIVSTPREVARFMRALLGGELLPAEMLAEMLDAVESPWPETDRYGLGVGEISAFMGGVRSPCGPAWGHLGFSLGYVAVALSSEDGSRQVVLCTNSQPVTEADADVLYDAAGRLLWHLYCS